MASYWKFGNYDYPCMNIPSLPVCNLLFRQMYSDPYKKTAPATSILGLPSKSSSSFTKAVDYYGSGINPACSIPRMGGAGGDPNSNGNVANIALCVISVVLGLILWRVAHRRKSAVARSEMSFFFFLYALVQLFQIFATGAFLRAGSNALVWLTGIHQGLVVFLFWVLLWAGFLSFQYLEDGSRKAHVTLFLMGFILFFGTTYISLDTAFTVSGYFQSKPAANLTNKWLAVLTTIVPAVCAFVYFVIQLWISLRILKEKRPFFLFFFAAFLFILSQVFYYALSNSICHASNTHVDGSFAATMFESFALLFVFLGWRASTE